MIESIAAGVLIIALAFAVYDAQNGFSSIPWHRVLAVAVFLLGMFWAGAGYSRDLGQWENSDPAIKQWYKGLMQPDNPTIPCCGEADAYWCDNWYVRSGSTFCKITDDRDDAPLGRPHVEIGTEIQIPDHKLKWDRSNPTGHVIVFLSYRRDVLCFVQGTGS